MTTSAAQPLTLLPLCGSVEPDYEPFQYFILRAYGFGVDISSPSTVSLCYMLKEFDVVHLHLPFKKGDSFVSRGMVQSITQHPTTQEHTYRLNFMPEAPRPYPFRITIRKDHSACFESDLTDSETLKDVIRECLLLKKGVAVYLKHLAAYFSHLVGNQYDSYPAFNRFFFDDIRARMVDRITRLEQIDAELEKEPTQAEVYLTKNFQEIQDLIEPAGVNINLLNLAFKEGEHLPYIIAIKELEEQLYWHYNTLILLYEPSVRAHTEKSLNLLQNLQQQCMTVAAAEG